MAWSYSALTSFELCPRKHWHLSIARDIKEKFNDAADYGSQVHKALELRLLKKKQLPLDMRHLEKYAAKLESFPGELMTEQKLALNKNYEPTGFFDPDVWLRGIIDLTIVNDNKMIVLDYKTGRMQDDFDQVKLQAAMMMRVLPDIDTVKAGYFWVKNKKFTWTDMTKEDAIEVWNEFIPRVNRMEDSIKNEEFPARQNFLCKRHCPVKQCQFNGS